MFSIRYLLTQRALFVETKAAHKKKAIEEKGTIKETKVRTARRGGRNRPLHQPCPSNSPESILFLLSCFSSLTRGTTTNTHTQRNEPRDTSTPCIPGPIYFFSSGVGQSLLRGGLSIFIRTEFDSGKKKTTRSQNRCPYESTCHTIK